MKVLATFNIKGGVGKTATAVNLAFLAAEAGYRVLLWDLDPQGATSFYFRVRPKKKARGKAMVKKKSSLEALVRASDFEGLDVLPADLSLRHLDLHLAAAKKPIDRLASLLLPASLSYDLALLDCAPSLSLVSDAIFVAADVLLVPTIPTTLSLRTLNQILEHATKPRFPRLVIRPFFCMVDRRKKLHREIVDQPWTELRFLKTHIPYSSVVEQMGIHRAPLFHYARNSEASEAYRRLWHEVSLLLGD